MLLLFVLFQWTQIPNSIGHKHSFSFLKIYTSKILRVLFYIVNIFQLKVLKQQIHMKDERSKSFFSYVLIFYTIFPLEFIYLLVLHFNTHTCTYIHACRFHTHFISQYHILRVFSKHLFRSVIERVCIFHIINATVSSLLLVHYICIVFTPPHGTSYIIDLIILPMKGHLTTLSI